MADYTRINFNIKTSILEELEQYTGDSNYGRSALLNFLVASALANKPVTDAIKQLREEQRTSM